VLCAINMYTAYKAYEKNADADDMEAFVKMHGMECIECGTCNYNCPANRNITQSVRTMKRKVQAARRKG
jgi:electron transport complex protein RnfC